MPALRLALPGDAPSLAILAERSFRDAFGARNSPENMDLHCAKCFGPDIQLREIGERGLLTTLADEAGSLAGFTQLRLARPSPAVTAQKPAELSRIYVAAEWHGRGIAQSLMDRAVADAARAGCDVLWLGVWEHNPKAMAFYRKFGFEIVGTQSFMLGQERQRDLVMSVGIG
jgi:ribosomal protein S18 acetylase RimI-like enzyme